MRTIQLWLVVFLGCLSASVNAQTSVFDGLQAEMLVACPLVWEDLGMPINPVGYPSGVFTDQADKDAFIAQYITDYGVTQAVADQVADTTAAVASVCGSYRTALLDTLVASNSADTVVATQSSNGGNALLIDPAAPANSLVIAADGDIGIGTSSPGTLTFGEEASIHVQRADGSAAVLVEETGAITAARGMLELRNNGGSYITLRNTATNDDWYMTHQNSDAGSLLLVSVLDGVNDGPELTLTADGNLITAGSVNASGLEVSGTGNKIVELESTDSGAVQLRLISDVVDNRRIVSKNIAGDNLTQIQLGDSEILLSGATMGGASGDYWAKFSSDGMVTSGNVGLGTDFPASEIHIQKAAGSKITMEDTSVARIWQLVLRGVDGDFAINDAASVGADFIFRGTGNLEIAGDLVTGGTGTCAPPNPPCDGVFRTGYEIDTIEEHSDYMWKNAHLPSVGPTLENKPINLTSKTTGILNELEKAHIYIDQLNTDAKSTKQELDRLNTVLVKLQSRLAELEK